MSRRIRVVRDVKGERPYGLPGPLPEGETMLWQGAPDARMLARRAMHVRKVAVYFGILALWCAGSAGLSDRPSLWFSAVALIVLGAIASGLLGLFAFLVARTTVYTMTEKRVVLRIGIALPMSINLPFSSIDSASVRLYPDGTGDIPILLNGPNRIGVTTLWPHVRPWRLSRVQPMLRAIPDAARVATMLSRALAASAGQSAPAAPLAAPARARRAGADYPASVGA